MKKIWYYDLYRLKGHNIDSYIIKFYKYLRRAQYSNNKLIKNINRFLFHYHALRRGIEICSSTKIGYGFCIWHPFNITIGQACEIGNNVTVNRGVLLGREFRGKRRGCPKIGNKVWIGTNACVVGGVRIGNNVLIAPNSFVNCDVPDNSIVFGNPCVIKHNEKATIHYIQNIVSFNDGG